MPRPDASLPGYSPPAFAQMFREDVAAEVPAIRLTHDEWSKIQLIIRTLADLFDDTLPANPETTLIQGKVIAPAMRQAQELRYLLSK